MSSGRRNRVMNTDRWLWLTLIWVALCVAMPQLPVDRDLGNEGARAIHPFFKWRLFAGNTPDELHSNLAAEGCEGVAGSFEPLGENFRWPFSRWRSKHRVNYIGRLFRAGYTEEARKVLRRFVERQLPDLVHRKCNVFLFHYHFLGDLNARQEQPESRLEF